MRALFESHGELRRVLVPPAGTLAVVEFTHADDGRKAFRAVAYRRLGNSVVYLEKGPDGMFITDEPMTDAAEPITATGTAPIAAPDAAVAEAKAGADEPALSAGTTLFVKNLAFSTTAEKLVAVMQHLPEYAFARVQTKPDPARPGARLSMGYGFVGFRTMDGAKRGLKSIDGMVLDGHKLSAKWAGRGAEEADGAADKETVKARTTKMIVKNVPFEATKKDIRELFGCVDPLSYLYLRSGSLTGFLRQCTCAAQVRAGTSQVRPSHARFRVPRVHDAARGRARVRHAPAHPFPRTALGARVG